MNLTALIQSIMYHFMFLQDLPTMQIYSYINHPKCFVSILFKTVTHNILVYGQVQIIVAVTSVLNLSNEVEYEDQNFEGFW